MKKILFAAAYMLLTATIMSCDNMPDDDARNQYFSTDDVFVPLPPPPPPPPVPPKGMGN